MTINAPWSHKPLCVRKSDKKEGPGLHRGLPRFVDFFAGMISCFRPTIHASGFPALPIHAAPDKRRDDRSG
jgi:hypothetical protein